MLSDGSLAATIAYVRDYGNALQRTLLHMVISGTTDDSLEEEARHIWLVGRNRDGGWGDVSGAPAPNAEGMPSRIAPTVRALIHAHDMGLGVAPEVRSGLQWLSRQQHRDGAFRETLASAVDTSGSNTPPEDMAILALHTAEALYTLDLWLVGVGMFHEQREHAYEWLCTHITSWHEQLLRTAWLTAAAARLRGGQQSQRSVSIAAYLTLSLSDPSRHWDDAAPLADMITVLARAGWPRNESPISCALQQLRRLRHPVGSFAATPDSDVVDTTLASLRALSLAYQPTHR